jgi:hypothetical protein
MNKYCFRNRLQNPLSLLTRPLFMFTFNQFYVLQRNTYNLVIFRQITSFYVKFFATDLLKQHVNQNYYLKHQIHLSAYDPREIMLGV